MEIENANSITKSFKTGLFLSLFFMTVSLIAKPGDWKKPS